MLILYLENMTELTKPNDIQLTFCSMILAGTPLLNAYRQMLLILNFINNYSEIKVTVATSARSLLYKQADNVE